MKDTEREGERESYCALLHFFKTNEGDAFPRVDGLAPTREYTHTSQCLPRRDGREKLLHDLLCIHEEVLAFCFERANYLAD
jgi:hypothetical protein